MKTEPAAPRLGHVRPQILNREIRLGTFGRGVKFRQLIEQEVARRHAHVVRDLRRLRAKAIEFEPHSDNGLVVRSHRAGLKIVRIECPMIGAQRADTPAVHMSGAIRRSTTFFARPRGTKRGHVHQRLVKETVEFLVARLDLTTVLQSAIVRE